MEKTIELTPQTKQIINPEDYLRLTDSEKRNIKKSKFVPPQLGSNNFGCFELILKNPIFINNK